MSNWFTGETKSLKADSAIQAADFLGVRPQWLIDGTGPMRPQLGPVVPMAAEPPKRYGAPSLADALDVLARALREAHPTLRDALASNLSGWARSGDSEPWQRIVQQLLAGAELEESTGTIG